MKINTLPNQYQLIAENKQDRDFLKRARQTVTEYNRHKLTFTQAYIDGEGVTVIEVRGASQS
jgi:hypothetical protein